jgi:hypothetical protein
MKTTIAMFVLLVSLGITIEKTIVTDKNISDLTTVHTISEPGGGGSQIPPPPPQA